MKNQYLILHLFFLGILVLASCKPEVDNFPSTSGNVNPSTIEKANLLAYFPFESTSYSTIKSIGIDSSSVTYGAKDLFVVGQRGFSFQGDTTKSFIQYKLLANKAFQNLKEFTLSSWIKVPDPKNNRVAQIIMIDGGDLASGAGSFSISFDSLYMKGYLYSDSIEVKSHEIKIERGLLKSNQWVHIAFTYNDSTSTMAFFANGILLKEKTCYANADSTVKMGSLKLAKLNMTKLYIGAWAQQVLGISTSSMTYFTGGIDEMRIWKKCLSKETISLLYKAEWSLAKNQ